MATRKKKSTELSPEHQKAFDRLREMILEAEPGVLINTLLAMEDEALKEALATPVYDLYRQVWSGKIESKSRNHFSNAQLAVVALAGLADAKRAQVTFFWGKPEIEEGYIALLRRRPPAWQASWLKAQLAMRDSVLSWNIIDAIIAGGAPLDMDSEDLACHFGNRYNDVNASLTARLRASPHLLPLIPRLFEVPSGAFTNTLAKHRDRWPLFETWGETLLGLCQSGHLKRSDLLRLSAEAMTRDLPPLQLGALADFHGSLKPDDAERAALEERYLELLGSPNSKVAGAAVKWCLSLKKVDETAFLRAAEPVMRLATKTVPVRVLQAAGRMVARDPGLRTAVVHLTEAAMTHSNREVLEIARSLLSSLGEDIEPAAPEVSEDASSAVEPLELEGIEPRWIELFGLRGEGMPGPFSYDIGEVPFRVVPITPIADLAELIDTVASAVEECRSGDEIERILDGLSRLGGTRPAHFELRTQALRRRVETMVDSETVKGIVSGWGGVSREIKGLLLSWLSGRLVHIAVPKYARKGALFPFIQGRLRELSARIVEGYCAPLLSAPTHAGGWILPGALVDRLRQCQAPDMHRFDLVAALIRLSPHEKAQALGRAADLKGEEGRALRWALGADVGPGRKDRRGELWLAAGRARQPRQELTTQLGFEEPARRLSWSVRKEGKPPEWSGSEPPVTSPVKGLVSTVKGLFGRVRPGPELDPTGCCYGTVLQGWNEPDSHGAWSLHWRALVWPGNLDSYWRQAALCLAERWDMEGSGMAPNGVYLEPLFEPDRPWDDLALVTIFMALTSKASEIRGAAVDLLITGISDGRAHPLPLGEVLRKLSRSGVKTNRLAEALGEVARAGELHRATVAGLVSQLLLDPLPHAGHHLLELLLETGRSLDPELRQALSKRAGSGKAGKLVARLLQLPEVSEPGISEQMRLARLNRARAWSTTRVSAPG